MSENTEPPTVEVNQNAVNDESKTVNDESNTVNDESNPVNDNQSNAVNDQSNTSNETQVSEPKTTKKAVSFMLDVELSLKLWLILLKVLIWII